MGNEEIVWRSEVIHCHRPKMFMIAIIPSDTLELLSNTETKEVLLEFEFINKITFRLDFSSSFSIVQAFPICPIR